MLGDRNAFRPRGLVDGRDVDGRALLEQIERAASELRASVSSWGFAGDAEAGAAAADAADAYLTGAGARLLERSENGDDGAHDRLMSSGSRILAALGTTFDDVSNGAMVGDFIADVAKDIADKAPKAALGVGGLAAGVAVLVLVLVLVTRRGVA